MVNKALESELYWRYHDLFDQGYIYKGNCQVGQTGQEFYKSILQKKEGETFPYLAVKEICNSNARLGSLKYFKVGKFGLELQLKTPAYNMLGEEMDDHWAIFVRNKEK